MENFLEKAALNMLLVIIFGLIYGLLAFVYLWRVGGL